MPELPIDLRFYSAGSSDSTDMVMLAPSEVMFSFMSSSESLIVSCCTNFCEDYRWAKELAILSLGKALGKIT